MYKYVFTDEQRRYTRITKHKARALWGKEDIALCPVKLRPGLPFSMHMVVYAKDIIDSIASTYEHVRAHVSFDYVVGCFEQYNCSYETGYYAAFYLVAARSEG